MTSGVTANVVSKSVDPHGGLHRLDELLTPAKRDTLSSIDAVNDRNQLLVWVQRADRTMFKEVVQLR